MLNCFMFGRLKCGCYLEKFIQRLYVVLCQRLHQNSSKQQTRSQLQTQTMCDCGGDHPRKTCRFYNAKCNHCKKIGHIARVCGSKAAVVTQQQQPYESAVVPISSKHHQIDIPAMVQILQLPKMQKRLHLMVDSASPITFINVKT